jgi:hypothetical protein
MRRVSGTPVLPSAALLLALPLLFSAALAVGVQIEPAAISEGNPVSVTLLNFTDGYVLNTTLIFAFQPSSSGSWVNITNWKNAFALTGGDVTVTGENVNRITLLVRAGSSLKSAPPKPGTGTISLTLPLDFPAEIYYDYRIQYEVHNASRPLTFTLTQEGIKAGPDDSTFTPSIFGVREGTLTVEILANGTLQASRVINVTQVLPATIPSPGTTTATPPPSPAPTTVPAIPTPETTVPATMNTPVQTPSPTAAPAPVAGPEAPSPGILGFATVIVIIAIIADYILLKD